jgi:hypothetical protein
MYDLEMSEEDAPMSIFARAGEHGYHFLKRNCGFIDADERQAAKFYKCDQPVPLVPGCKLIVLDKYRGMKTRVN